MAINKSSDAYLISTVEPKIDLIQTKTDNLPNNTSTALSTIDAFHDVPAQNSADNNQMRDAIGNKTDTAESGDSLISIAKGARAFGSTTDQTGTFSYLDAGAEQTVLELTPTTRKIVRSIWLDMTNLTQDGAVKLYYKIDGSNYREFEEYSFAVATDSDGFLIPLGIAITSDFKITYTEDADEGAARAIPYQVILENKE